MESESSSILNRRSISADLFEKLVFYFKYASSAYNVVCPRPNGNHLVMLVNNPTTDIQGFVARDDTRKEIVVALRGSSSITDVLIDGQIELVPFISPETKLPSGARVHAGFLVSWDSIAIQVIALVAKQISDHPGYSIVTTGHSLGGSMALLAAITLQQHFESAVVVKTYSYGAPRTGNKIFAEFVNETFGENSYRVVHGKDGVPTMIPTQLGYHHHGIEYWQHADPPSEHSTTKCSAEGEDASCSASIPSQGVNTAHMTYFGILATTPFCF